MNGLLISGDIITLSPIADLTLFSSVSDVPVRPLRPSDRDSSAELHLASYPPNIGSVDLAGAVAEMDAILSGKYGILRFDASFVALSDDTPVGAILTTSRSVWDPELDSPFMIELFVSPRYRQLGAGRALVIQAVRACGQNRDQAVSLCVGEGTSPAAFRLYEQLGFRRHSLMAPSSNG